MGQLPWSSWEDQCYHKGLIKGRGQTRARERLEDDRSLALKIEDEAISQGRQSASREKARNRIL
jgi:hypothetical protein